MLNGTAIQCPKCKHDKQRVTETRADHGRLRRRRECAKCGHRFSTHETIIKE